MAEETTLLAAPVVHKHTYFRSHNCDEHTRETAPLSQCPNVNETVSGMGAVPCCPTHDVRLSIEDPRAIRESKQNSIFAGAAGTQTLERPIRSQP